MPIRALGGVRIHTPGASSRRALTRVSIRTLRKGKVEKLFRARGIVWAHHFVAARYTILCWSTSLVRSRRSRIGFSYGNDQQCYGHHNGASAFSSATLCQGVVGCRNESLLDAGFVIDSADDDGDSAV